MAWLLNPKNAAMVALAFLIVSLGGYSLWLRGNLAIKAGRLAEVQVELAATKTQLQAVVENREQIKVLSGKIKDIAVHAQKISARIDGLIIDGGKNEEAFSLYNGLVDSFNGVRGKESGDPSKVLPETTTPGIGKTGRD